jgi:hypothetical protein
MGSGSGAGQNQQFPGYVGTLGGPGGYGGLGAAGPGGVLDRGMNQQYSGPNWWAGQGAMGGQQQGGGQPLWQNPFSPMTPADWDALKEQYYPKPVSPPPPMPPEPGTLPHAQQQAAQAGYTPSFNTGSPEYASYLRAMGTIFGTPTTTINQFSGEGEAGTEIQGYVYQGKFYEPDRAALNWAKNLAQTQGGIGPGQAESLYGPHANPAIFGTIAAKLQEWGVPASFLEVTHPAFQGPGGGPGGDFGTGLAGHEMGSGAGGGGPGDIGVA